MLKLNSVVLLILIAVLNLFAQDKPVFVDEYLGQVSFVEGRLLQLEGAMPEDKMNWTPAEGVRNCAEVYLHVAEANYMLVKFIKGEKLEGEPGSLEKSTTNRDEVAQTLKDSFTAVKDAVANLNEDDLNKVMKTLFGMEMSTRNFMISLLGHMHEHLGQGIAYARMNGVVPPWSKKQDSEG